MPVRIVIPGESVYAYDTTVGDILEAKRNGRVMSLQRLFADIDGGYVKEREVYVDAAHISSFYES